MSTSGSSTGGAASADGAGVDTSRDGRRAVLASVARVLLVSVLLLVIYFAAPITRNRSVTGWAMFVLGLIALGVVLVFQIRRILIDPRPRLRAVETLGIALPAFIVMFALVYLALSEADPGTFSEPMTRVAALYFTVTVLSTVGFGDITAQTDVSRAVVTGQMLLGLVLIGVVVRIVIGASRIGMERRKAAADDGD